MFRPTMRRRDVVLFASLTLSVTRCASCINQAIHPDAVRYQNAGIKYLEDGECIQAEESFRLALEYGPKFANPHNGLGMVSLMCKNDLEEASQHFKNALAINSDFAEAHNNLGTTFFRQNPPRYGEACERFEAALEINPEYIDARENLGMCLLRRGTVKGDQGDTKEREKSFQKARSHMIRLIEIDPTHVNARHHLGFMDLVEKRYAPAEQYFKKCLELDPENPVCSYNLGNVYLQTARCGEAIQAFIAALRDPDATEVSVGARQNLGVSYELCARNDGAIRQFLDRIRSDPGNPTHHYDLGRIYMQKGLSDQAVNEWENTIKLDPSYCPAYYNLAMHANRLLDGDTTITRCQDFVACANEAARKRPSSPPRWPDRVEKCKELVRKLEME